MMHSAALFIVYFVSYNLYCVCPYKHIFSPPQSVLFANLARTPTLLPSQRSANQLKLAYKMLSDCHRYVHLITFIPLVGHVLIFYCRPFFFCCRYGMNTANCRAKSLVEYFGEQFSYEKCYLYIAYPFLFFFCRMCSLELWSIEQLHHAEN